MKNSQIHVLVVDDDLALLASIEILFNSLGFQILTATSGKAALEIIKTKLVHVVLSDIRMQDGDGWYLAKMVKTLPNHPKILFITGYSEHTVEHVFHEGIDGFFEKPFDASAVKTAIIRTCVRPQDRWQVIPTATIQGAVSYSGKTIGDLNVKNGIYFGRGGFCFNHDNLHLPEGAVIDFEVSIGSQAPFSKIKGVGQIMWKHIRQGSTAIGYGLEIEFLENDGPTVYQKAFGKEVSWIPSMNIIAASQSA
jgi:CheY-like chemotaxis protein